MAAADGGDDDDYMSDAFLAQLAQAETKRPTRVDPRHDTATWKRRERVRQRQAQAEELTKQQSTTTKRARLAAVEAESRDKALATPLDQSNKGFQLLAKMGFKAGSGLGKRESGRTEPVAVQLKQGRQGLGREALLAARQRVKVMARQRKRQDLELSTSEFRRRMQQKFSQKTLERDLTNAQRACEQLDMKAGVERTELWPLRAAPEKPLQDDDMPLQHYEPPEPTEFETLEVGERLQVVAEYLRSAHMYCTWCGIQFNDAEHLARACPGNTAEDHEEM
eukprot:m.27398 g.27398  ORF g.27398 m.27398 type:complete len:279 (-) comp8532_c0_seq1:61-897(-)